MSCIAVLFVLVVQVSLVPSAHGAVTSQLSDEYIFPAYTCLAWIKKTGLARKDKNVQCANHDLDYDHIITLNNLRLIKVDTRLLDAFESLEIAKCENSCEINPFALGTPLLIENGKSSIIYPKYNENTVKFRTGEIVEFSCSERFIVLDGNQTNSIVKATCVSDDRFSILGEVHSWGRISCNNNPLPIGRFATGSCSNTGRLAEIGFILDNQRFLQTIKLCFDTANQTPLYSQVEISSTIAVSATGNPRPTFHLDGGFYNIYDGSVKHLYVRETQRSTINNLLGLGETSEKYIRTNDLFFLSKGHLTANSDMVYAAQKNSTFRYINTAPQWQSINGFNWNQAEKDTRDYASSHNASLSVWTGTYGVASLPHEQTGQETELYLYVHYKSLGLPIPAIFWKLVYNPVNKKGIVLITVNNPYLNQTSVQKYVFCKDVSQSVPWLKWDKNNIPHGYSYACAVPDFRKVMMYAPNLVVTELLL